VDNPAPLNMPIDGPMITARQVISSWSMPRAEITSYKPTSRDLFGQQRAVASAR